MLYRQGNKCTYAFVNQFETGVDTYELGSELNFMVRDNAGQPIWGNGWTPAEFKAFLEVLVSGGHKRSRSRTQTASNALTSPPRQPLPPSLSDAPNPATAEADNAWQPGSTYMPDDSAFIESQNQG